MKRRVLLVLLVAVIAIPNVAFGWGEVRKAKKFMKAGMYPQAIQVLDKRINDEPDDAEAHFQLGICYIRTGNLSGADARFASAVRLDSDYGYKIGGEYEKAGSNALAGGNVDKALMLFRKAVTYQPGLKKEIAGKCFRAGVTTLKTGPPGKAIRLFQTASTYDPSLREAAAKKCYEKADALFRMAMARNGDSGRLGVRFSGEAENLSGFVRENTSVYNAKIKKAELGYARQCLEIAKSKSKGHREPYLSEAKKYLSQKEINKAIPPPSWKTVFEKEFVGVGFTGGDEPEDNDGTIHIAELGKDIQIGDKTIIKTYGNNVEIWDEGKWQKYQHPIINTIGTHGNFCARAAKGVKFKVIVQRFE